MPQLWWIPTCLLASTVPRSTTWSIVQPHSLMWKTLRPQASFTQHSASRWGTPALSEGCRAVVYTAENHCWLWDAPSLSSGAVNGPRKASAPRKAALVFSECIVALAIQFNPHGARQPRPSLHPLQVRAHPVPDHWCLGVWRKLWELNLNSVAWTMSPVTGSVIWTSLVYSAGSRCPTTSQHPCSACICPLSLHWGSPHISASASALFLLPSGRCDLWVPGVTEQWLVQEQSPVQTLPGTLVKEAGHPYPEMQTAAPCVLCHVG